MLFCQQSLPLATCVLIKIYMAILSMASLSCHCQHWLNVKPTSSLYSHLLFGFHKCSASSNECQQGQFYLRRIQRSNYLPSTNNRSEIFFQKSCIFIAAHACNSDRNTHIWKWDYTSLVNCLPVAVILSPAGGNTASWNSYDLHCLNCAVFLNLLVVHVKETLAAYYYPHLEPFNSLPEVF